jgi:hypothetical protein
MIIGEWGEGGLGGDGDGRKDKGHTQSTHRVAMAIFWRTFHHDGKISPAW